MSNIDYPWYRRVEGDDLEQGDILIAVPVIELPADLKVGAQVANATLVERNVIVMTQSCDLVKDQKVKTDQALLCAVWTRSELKAAENKIADKDRMESARNGRVVNVHLLNECLIPNLEREYSIVDFTCLYTLPLPLLRNIASSQPRIRLLPPYREHLSQAFARSFMRVGLPSTIPKFTT